MAEAGTPTIDGAGPTRGRVARARFASFIQRQGSLVALVLVCAFAAMRYAQFLDETNLTNVLRQNSMLGLVAFGMTFVILTGGIDLSVGSLVAVAGVAAAGTAPRLTRIGGFHVDVMPRRNMIVLTNQDVPGVIGRVGTLLGDAGVNIAEYHQARLAQGGEALAAISVDGAADAALRQRLLDLPDVQSATIITFRE